MSKAGEANLFMDLLIIDTRISKGWVFGYDGFLTMTVPDSLIKPIAEKVKKKQREATNS